MKKYALWVVTDANGVSTSECGLQDSNLHGLARRQPRSVPSGFQTRRVYRFRQTRTELPNRALGSG